MRYLNVRVEDSQIYCEYYNYHNGKIGVLFNTAISLHDQLMEISHS